MAINARFLRTIATFLINLRGEFLFIVVTIDTGSSANALRNVFFYSVCYIGAKFITYKKSFDNFMRKL